MACAKTSCSTPAPSGHAERVCELGKVAHRLGQGDDPETRLREDHIEARAVGEAMARASSADAALNAVFDSPSHRLAVTERNFTDAGIGQASTARATLAWWCCWLPGRAALPERWLAGLHASAG